MHYRVVDRSQYYRKGVYRHFTEDCKCSVSMTARIDVTDLADCSARRGSKFYIDFLYILCKEGGRLMMPVTIRMNHAIADGYLVAKVFKLLEDSIRTFCLSNS